MNENMDCRVMKTCQEVQKLLGEDYEVQIQKTCLLYTSPSPRD